MVGGVIGLVAVVLLVLIVMRPHSAFALPSLSYTLPMLGHSCSCSCSCCSCCFCCCCSSSSCRFW